MAKKKEEISIDAVEAETVGTEGTAGDCPDPGGAERGSRALC